MSRAVIKLPRAESDLIGCYAYLGEEASIQTADRFLNAVEKTLNLIATSPGIGATHQTNKLQLAGLRVLAVSKFKRYLLFYRAFDDRIELVRVLHGARDIRRILDAERDDVEWTPPLFLLTDWFPLPYPGKLYVIDRVSIHGLVGSDPRARFDRTSALSKL